MKTISVLIPVYNQGQYLAQAIESVVNQTETPLEVIVINDGSTDNSLEVAKSYPVEIINQTNRGLSSARNTGIMNAKGDFVLPLDADDMMLENCIEKISQVIERTDADIIAPSFKCFGTNNNPVILMFDPKLGDFKAGNRIGYFSAIKKSCLLEVGGYSSRMTWGYEDFHLWINLLTLGKKLITLPEVLMLYRVKESSMITESIKHHDELMGQIYKDFPNFQ